MEAIASTLSISAFFGSTKADSPHSLIPVISFTKSNRVSSKSLSTGPLFSSPSKGLNGHRQNGSVAATGDGGSVAATGGGDIGGGRCKYCGGSGGGGGGGGEGGDKDYVINELMKKFVILFTLYNIFDTFSYCYVSRWERFVSEELKRNPHIDLEEPETKWMLAKKASGIYALGEFLGCSL